MMGESPQVQKLSFGPKRLRIDWTDGHQSDYDAIWLRDNCPEDRDAHTGQRLVDIADLPDEPAIGAVSQNSEAAVLITWCGEPKSSWFNLEWLRNQCYCGGHQRSPNRPVIAWTADRSGELLWLQYDEVLASDRTHAQWLRALADYGIAFLQNVPCEHGKVAGIAQAIGYIRETNYGRLFDVQSVANPNNLAYSDRGLGVHTDNPYRDPVPGLQILHCLQASDEGGDSLFVDGFAVAESLRSREPQAFETLTRVQVPFRFRDQDTDLRAQRPLLQLGAAGELEAVHYNSRSIAPLGLPPDELMQFYRAYRAFARSLRSPEFEFRTKLGNGCLVAFDNRRVLHGRTAFNAAGRRWLQGCYVDRDGLLSNLAVLERKL
jgi:gamma-butyrobetaine hydroxylase